MASSALPGFIAKLLIDDAGGTPAEIAEVRELTLNHEMEPIDVTSHDSLEFREFIRGLRSWSIDVGVLHLSGEVEQGKMRQAILNGTFMDMELLESGSSGSGDPKWSGTVLISANTISFPVDDAMTGDITLQGSGVLVLSTLP